MYLVTEAEYNKLNKRRKKSNLPQDVQVVTDSLKAISQKRKKQSIAASLPRIQMRKYNVNGGVASMTDRDVTKPLPRHRRAAGAARAPASQRAPSPQPINLQRYNVGTPRRATSSTGARLPL